MLTMSNFRDYKSTFVVIAFMILDYVLTYIGIAKGIIIESNALMVFLFNHGFVVGLVIRIIMVSIVIPPYFMLQTLDSQKHQKLIGITYSVYSIVFLLHLKWIILS